MNILLVCIGFHRIAATPHDVYKRLGGACPGVVDTIEDDTRSCIHDQLASEPFHQNNGRMLLQMKSGLRNASLVSSASKEHSNTTGDEMVWVSKVENILIESATDYLRMFKPFYENRPYKKVCIFLTLQFTLLMLVVAFAVMHFTQVGDTEAVLLPAGKTPDTPEKYFKITFNELTTMLGIPAFTVFHFSEVGLTGLQRRYSILCLAAQSWILQGAALTLIVEGLRTYEKPPLSVWLVALATYLNMLAHMGELPVAFLLLRYGGHFHNGLGDKVFAFAICLVGGVLIPCASIVVGAMFMSTSENLCDLMMKSIVFKFISNIDTWVTALNSRTNMLSGISGPPPEVYLPNNRSFARILNYILCIFPVVPAMVTVCLAAAGVAVRSHTFLG